MTPAEQLYEWLREPDFVESASMEWLLEWVNRRPLKAALLCLAEGEKHRNATIAGQRGEP